MYSPIHSLIRFLTIAALLNVVTACLGRPTFPSAVSPEAIPLVVSQAACETTGTSSSPDLRMPPRPATLIGGGLLDEGQFTFDLWLYCDPDLSAEGSGPLMSEVGGLGVHLAWRYHGPKVTGSTESFLGFSDGNEPRAIWEGGLAPGTAGSFTGGVRSLDGDLTEAVRSGVPISFEIVVTVNDSPYGAKLTFKMMPVPDGYRPIEIVAAPVR